MTPYEPNNRNGPWRYAPPPGVSGLLAARVFGFFVDAVIISVLFYLFFIVLAFAGFVTFGLAWFLLPPLFWLVALLYNGIMISGPARGTFGMRLFGIEMETMEGAAVPFLTAAVHAVIFYITVSVLTPFILLIGLVRDDRRMLHDILTGVMAVRSAR